MGKQPFNGHEIAATELSAAELIPAYTIVKFNSADKTKCNLAGAGDSGLGVAIPSDEEMMPDGNGGIVKRTGWNVGDFPTIYDDGTVWVILGAVVTADQYCVPMAGGLGAGLATTGLTLANIPTILGKYRVGGNIGDIVPVKIK
jgi:hypothetical protein